MGGVRRILAFNGATGFGFVAMRRAAGMFFKGACGAAKRSGEQVVAALHFSNRD
jgi:hypothetical protein